ncbi:MAG TPA: hypothetical protein EYQ73_00110 [Candidatus Poseidoniales archaeon]|jgi:gamma-glutamylcyclotransferase (GGCT)/AIG2-like uncharacterized protein YtfP|nr:MAG: hypothetical protein CXT71_05970 [Euryarchaeota archaeon]HIF45194.1 hypothetical protein [Candidatus Poseidoniales archaeon]HIL66199.1 hypothetical protein [Candidatus Poseidoniales archaeon]
MTLYFAYGSNLNVADWTKWCNDFGFNPEGMTEICPAWLPGYSLKFHYYSQGRGGGAADVVKTETGCAVPGVLFELDDKALAAMDEKEGHPKYYQRKWVDICCPNGDSKKALTYTVVQSKLQPNYIQPTDSYIELISSGLKKRGLPISDLVNAIEDEASHFPIKDVFVYGTLLSGESRAPIIKNLNGILISDATCEGVLVDLGSYPGLLIGTELVRGELYEFEDLKTALQRLDSIEGVDAGLYRRHIISVETDIGPQWAWTYFYNGEEKNNQIESGSWKNRN